MPKAVESKKDIWLFIVLIAIIQITCIVLYAIFFEYPDAISGSHAEEDAEPWPLVRDVSVMIFVGFGFLMTFLKKYGYSAVGYTTLISAVVMECALIIRCMYGIDWDSGAGRCDVGVHAVLDALFCAGAVMISFGALLGRTTPTQLIILGVLETFAFFGNLKIFLNWEDKGVHDIGGGLTIHTLGAYTGLVATCFLGKEREKDHPDNGSTYTSDLFSFVGTLFLWVMWPSFNAVLADRSDGSYARALVNTFVSLLGCTVVTMLASRSLDSQRKFEAVHFANSILAGGVVMGVAADLDLTWAGALSAGCAAGLISVLGYSFLTPALNRLGMVDVCGIHNLHGMPGLLSAIVGIGALGHLQSIEAARWESAALFVTLAIAILTGLVAGLLMKFYQSFFKIDLLFDDEETWITPHDGYARIPPVDLRLRKWLHSTDLKASDKAVLERTLSLHHFDMDTLSGATGEELNELGLPVGVKKRLVQQLQSAKSQFDNDPEEARRSISLGQKKDKKRASKDVEMTATSKKGKPKAKKPAEKSKGKKKAKDKESNEETSSSSSSSSYSSSPPSHSTSD